MGGVGDRAIGELFPIFLRSNSKITHSPKIKLHMQKKKKQISLLCAGITLTQCGKTGYFLLSEALIGNYKVFDQYKIQ